MSNNHQALNLRGYLLKVACLSKKHPNLLEWIMDDFASMKPILPGVLIAEIEIVDEIEISKKRWLPFFKRDSVQVFGWGQRKYYRYKNGCEAAIFFGPTHQVKMSGKNQEEIYEILYLLILSLAGQALENQGWMRFHAMLSRWKNKAYLLVANPGVGKSLLAAKLQQLEKSSSDYPQVLGDEMCFVKGEEVWSFPLRMALYPQVAQAAQVPITERWTYRDGKSLKIILNTELVEADPLPIEKIYFAKDKKEIWEKQDSKIHIHTWISLLFGKGLVQMIEYQFRFDNLGFLIRIFFNRLKEINFLKNKGLLEEISVGEISPEEFRKFISG